MLNVKRSFNGWTVLMFLGCLALSIVITQPILARADDGNNVEIKTEFDEVMDMSMYSLNVHNDVIVGNSLTIGDNIIESGKFCNTEGTCFSVDGDTISFNKIKIGLQNDSNAYIILSGTQTGVQLLTSNPEFNSRIPFYLNQMDKLVTIEAFPGQFEDRIEQDDFGWKKNIGSINNPTYITRPMWEKTGWIAGISFKEKDENMNTITCSEENAGTMHYLEMENGSQLIVCMKTGNDQYTGAVIKEYINQSFNDNN